MVISSGAKISSFKVPVENVFCCQNQKPSAAKATVANKEAKTNFTRIVYIVSTFLHPRKVLLANLLQKVFLYTSFREILQGRKVTLKKGLDNCCNLFVPLGYRAKRGSVPQCCKQVPEKVVGNEAHLSGLHTRTIQKGNCF